jgi:NADH dehydrogenase
VAASASAALRESAVSTERIVVIGGGAGGLELVVRLARKLRRSRSTEVVLVDKSPTHIWKPLLHEVATGSMNSYHDEVSYRMLGRKHGFGFALGRVVDIDLAARRIALAAITDDTGNEMLPARSLEYSEVVICVGSQCNDFGIEGVERFSKQLDSREQAEELHRLFTAQLYRVNSSDSPQTSLSLAIVGGGATGVELAADMHNVVERLRDYGFDHFSQGRLSVTVIEAAPRLLPQLPERIGASVAHELGQIGVTVRTGTRVARVERNGVVTSEDEIIPADISVWAAGVKAPDWLAKAGFPCDRLGRIEVESDLSVRGMTGVYAIGDCCRCRMDDGTEVPPRAQAAHQMATVAARNLLASRRNRRARAFVYHDFGSLVSLSRFSTIGNLMGNLMHGSVFVEGWLARMAYLSLYRMHQRAVFGVFSTLLIMLGDRIYKATRAEIKLH